MKKLSRYRCAILMFSFLIADIFDLNWPMTSIVRRRRCRLSFPKIRTCLMI